MSYLILFVINCLEVFKELLAAEVSRDTLWSTQKFVKITVPAVFNLPSAILTSYADYMKLCGEERARAKKKEASKYSRHKFYCL